MARAFNFHIGNVIFPLIAQDHFHLKAGKFVKAQTLKMQVEPIYGVGGFILQIFITHHAVFNRPVLHADGKALPGGSGSIPGCFFRRPDVRHVITAVFPAHNVNTRAVEGHFVYDQLVVQQRQQLKTHRHTVGRHQRFPVGHLAIQYGKAF